jgi:hypothetical protein
MMGEGLSAIQSARVSLVDLTDLLDLYRKLGSSSEPFWALNRKISYLQSNCTGVAPVHRFDIRRS